MTYSPITDFTETYYDISEFQVDLLLNWGTIFYLVAAPTCMHLGTSALGLRHLVIASAWFEFFAVVVRCIPLVVTSLQPHSIYFLHLAQISNAFACPPISVTVTKLSCVWFGDHERRTTTALAVVMNNVGTAVGMVLAPALVKAPEDMPRLLYVHLGFGLFCLICTMAHFPASPARHPSPAAAHMFQREPEPFFEALHIAARTPSFLLLIVGAGAVVGLFNTWSGILETVLTSSYSDSTIGWLSFSATVAGIVGGVVHGRVAQMAYFKVRMKSVILFLIVGAFLAATWFALSVPSVLSACPLLSEHPASIALSLTLLGWFVGSGYPLAFELAAEMTYPLSEAVTGGMMQMCSNGVGVVFLFLAPSLRPSLMNAFMVVAALAGVLLLPFVGENYKRVDAETRAREAASGNVNGAADVRTPAKEKSGSNLLGNYRRLGSKSDVLGGTTKPTAAAASLDPYSYQNFSATPEKPSDE